MGESVAGNGRMGWWRRSQYRQLPFHQRLLPLTILPGALATVMGFVGYSGCRPLPGAEPVDPWYATLQLFVGTFNTDCSATFGSLLWWARLLALVATLSGTVTVLLAIVRFPVDRWVARWARGHIVLLGDRPEVQRLAETLAFRPDRPFGWNIRLGRPVVWIGVPPEDRRQLAGVRRIAVDDSTGVGHALANAGRVVVLYRQLLDATHALDRVLHAALAPDAVVHVGLESDATAQAIAHAALRTTQPDRARLDVFCIGNRVLSELLAKHFPDDDTKLLAVAPPEIVANLEARVRMGGSRSELLVYPGPAPAPEPASQSKSKAPAADGVTADRFALAVEEWVRGWAGEEPNRPANEGDEPRPPTRVLMVLAGYADDYLVAAAVRASRCLDGFDGLASEVAVASRSDAGWGRSIPIWIRLYSAEGLLSDPHRLATTPADRVVAAAAARQGESPLLKRLDLRAQAAQRVVAAQRYLSGWRVDLVEPGEEGLPTAASLPEKVLLGAGDDGPVGEVLTNGSPGAGAAAILPSGTGAARLLQREFARAGVLLVAHPPYEGTFVDRLRYRTGRHFGTVDGGRVGLPQKPTPVDVTEVSERIAGWLCGEPIEPQHGGTGVAARDGWPQPDDGRRLVQFGEPRWFTSERLAELVSELDFADRDDASLLGCVMACAHIPYALAERGLCLARDTFGPGHTFDKAQLWFGARQAHLDYERRFGDVRPKGAETVALWEETDEFFRHQNLAAAHRSLVYDAFLRVRASRKGQGGASLPDYGVFPDAEDQWDRLPQEVRFLAEQEHQAWWYNRARAGWVQGVVRDDARRVHTMMVPWSEVGWDFRRRDVSVVVSVPLVLAAMKESTVQ